MIEDVPVFGTRALTFDVMMTRFSEFVPRGVVADLGLKIYGRAGRGVDVKRIACSH